jgi:hypothetical protein
MAYRLTSKGLQRLNEIADKYRFRNIFEITDIDDEVEQFISYFLEAIHLGLNVDEEDKEWIENIQEKLYC